MSHRRFAATLVVGTLGVLSACDGQPRGTSSAISEALTTTPVSGSTAEEADVRAYRESLVGPLRTGREVVERLRAGDLADVYDRTSPALTSTMTLQQVTDAFEQVVGDVPVGTRLRERAVTIGPGRSLYVAEHRAGTVAIRFTVITDDGGLVPLVERISAHADDGTEPAAVKLMLPFAGVWWVSEAAGDVGAHHAAVDDQRFALDFSRWHDGATYRTTGATNQDYWAWDERVLAPAAGTVITADDDRPDNVPRVDADPRNPAGNHVIIDLDGAGYAVLAHLRSGSVSVEVGDRLRPGDPIGRVGNSGNSYEPHLHLHVQDEPSFTPGGGGSGIPIRFVDLRVDGTSVPAAAPPGGSFVASQPR